MPRQPHETTGLSGRSGSRRGTLGSRGWTRRMPAPMPPRVIAALAACVCLAACRDEQAGPKPRPGPGPAARPTQPAPPAGVRALDAAPSDLTYRSGATLAGGAIVYLGAKVEPADVQPGRPVQLRH